jgi:hypothetical protein
MHRILVLVSLVAVPFLVMTACGGDSTSNGTDSGTALSDSGSSDLVDSGSTPHDSGSEALDSGDNTTPDSSTSTGACANTADRDIHGAMDVSAEVETCAQDCFGSGSCVTECVVRETALSESCAMCYGNATECARNECALRCISGESADCEACRDEKGCTAGFEACAGL